MILNCFCLRQTMSQNDSSMLFTQLNLQQEQFQPEEHFISGKLQNMFYMGHVCRTSGQKTISHVSCKETIITWNIR